jgi:muramoyltetrapeptide carboxypeptidase
MLAAILTICGTMTLTSCDNDDNSIVPTPDEAVVLNCVKPDYLKAGDKVALISPSYFTPMDNVEKTANVLRKWELEPVVGPNVGKVIDGQYAGTVAERVSDIRWAWRHQSSTGDGCSRHPRRASGRSHLAVQHRRRSE